MSDSPLTLGLFLFQGLEIPDRIIIRNKQRFAIHYTGSGPLTDSLGEDCQSISFRGTFTGTEAANRSRAVDRLRIEGTPLLLRWQSQTLFVLIKEFELTHKSGQWIDYRLQCLVVQAGFNTEAVAEDILVVSAAFQVGDAMGLLLNGSMASTATETAAFNTLARMNYDVAPEAESRLADQFITSVGQMLVNLDGRVQGVVTGLQTPADTSTHAMLQLFDGIGKRATLTMARNRLAEILIRANSATG